MSQAAPAKKADVVLVGIAYLSFIVIGMPGAMLGVAFPASIKDTFALKLEAVGALLVTVTASYFIASFLSGRLIARLGVGTLLVAGSFIACAGLIGYVVSPAWAVMVAFGLLVGLGAGFIDSVMNIYFAAVHGPRLMNWLHASFGIGATISPLVMTAILNAGGVWRSGYIILAALFGLTAVLFALTRGQWKSPQLHSSSDGARTSVSAWDTLRLPLTWVGIALFMIYAGQESTPGIWAFPLFTDARHVAEVTAGLWVSIYWLSFTVGRIIFGFIVSWVKARTLLNICWLGTIVGALLFWWHPVSEAGFGTAGANLVLENPSNTVGFIGLALFGFTLAPMFALLITSTQERLGPQHAPHAIGFQVAAASVGAGLLPGLAGVLAARQGLEIVPVFLLVLTALTGGLYFASTRPAMSMKSQAVAAAD